MDYENEYAEYELSKDWETSKKRSNMSKILACFFVLLILSGQCDFNSGNFEKP